MTTVYDNAFIFHKYIQNLVEKVMLKNTNYNYMKRHLVANNNPNKNKIFQTLRTARLIHGQKFIQKFAS